MTYAYFAHYHFKQRRMRMALTKKQKEVFDYIITYTENNGYSPTQREIKEYFNLKSFGSVQRYIKYLQQEGLIANDSNARRGLVALVNSPQKNTKQSQDQHFSETIEIPLLGNVAAGNPIEAIENPEATVAVPTSLIRTGKHFALKVQGDSMIEDGILEDDIVICRYQQTAQPSQRVIAIIDGEATVKKYVPKSNHIELHPANERLKPIMVNPYENQFHIAGVVVGLFRHYLV